MIEEISSASAYNKKKNYMLEEKMNEHEDYNSAIIWIITCNPAQEYQQIIDLHKRRGESMTMFTTECKVLTLIWMILVLQC